MAPDPPSAESVPNWDVSDVGALTRLASAIFSEGMEGFPAGAESPTVLAADPVRPEALGPGPLFVTDVRSAPVPDDGRGREVGTRALPDGPIPMSPASAGDAVGSSLSPPWVAAPSPPAGAALYYFLEHARPPSVPTGYPAFDVEAIRRDFPILNERVHGHQLVWLDNAATTQKPQAVIDRLAWYYEHENSNIHRGAHELAARATDAFEDARTKVARYIGASAPEIVFVRGTTEAINLVAQS